MACHSTDILRDLAGFKSQWIMVTLTYRDVDGYKPNDIVPFAEALRKWLERRDVPMVGVWSGELQERGALHYHVLLLVPRGLMLPKPDKRGWWKHGHTRVERVRKSAAGYISKYISKDEEARFPIGCRTHARWGMSEDQQRWIRHQLMPQWARDRWPDPRTADLRRAEGGGIVDRTTGDWLPSPFVVVFHSGSAWLYARDTS